jgi:hypothetical protein
LKWGKRLVTTKDCNENLDTLVECKKDCNGGMNCTNKRIQTCIWKKVDRRVTQGRDNGLFAMEDLKKGDFIIEYVGKIFYKEQDNKYGMRILIWIYGLTQQGKDVQQNT